MPCKPTFAEMEARIRHVAEFYGGKLPPDHSLAWEGYVAALVEWQLITMDEHEKLLAIIGKTPAAPALAIFLGPEGAHKTLEQNAPPKKKPRTTLHAR